MSDEIRKLPSGAAELRTEQGEVYLPEKRKMDPDSPEFLAAVSACLPPDAAGTVAARYAAGRRSYRRFEVLAILLALAGAGWLVCLCFPKPLPALPFKFEWRYAGPRFSTDSPYLPLYRAARADFDADRYEAVIRTLNEPLGSMLWERTFPGQDELFYIYFVSCSRTASRFTEWRRAASFAEELVRADPDNLQWRYFLARLQLQRLGDYRTFYAALRKAGDAQWRMQLAGAGEAIADLRDLRGKLRELSSPPGDGPEIMKQLDLWEAELLTFSWMLEGGRGTASFPDDFGQNGVEAREEAWVLTRKHEDDREALPFLSLQLFILDVLLEQDNFLNTIYWNGAVHASRKTLEAKRDAVLRRLPAGEGNRL